MKWNEMEWNGMKWNEMKCQNWVKKGKIPKNLPKNKSKNVKVFTLKS
jgi:hypothetical protein